MARIALGQNNRRWVRGASRLSLVPTPLIRRFQITTSLKIPMPLTCSVKETAD